MAKPSTKHAGNPALKSLGKTIRAVRADQKISQEALACEANLDRSYMWGIEQGQHNITLLSLMKITERLNIKASELLEKADL